MRGVPEVAGAETQRAVEAGLRGAGAEAWDPGSGTAERRLDPGRKRKDRGGWRAAGCGGVLGSFLAPRLERLAPLLRRAERLGSGAESGAGSRKAAVRAVTVASFYVGGAGVCLTWGLMAFISEPVLPKENHLQSFSPPLGGCC